MSNVRKDLPLEKLMFNQWRLYWNILDLPLLPQNSIVESNLERTWQIALSSWGRKDSSSGKGAYLHSESFVDVGDLCNKGTIVHDIRELIQKVHFGDSMVFEDDEAIVNAIKAFFSTTISYNYATHRIVIVPVSDLDQKGVWPMTLVIYVQLGEDRSSVSCLESPANPELHRIICRRVDDKLFLQLIICGCGFDSSHIRSMSQFCQSKAPNVNTLFCSFFPFIVLVCA